MNKEAEMHLSELPNLNKPRSTFPYNQTIWGSMSVGKLYPLACIECNPGDTLSLDFSHITRAMTQIVPVMDNSFLDVQAFAVPIRQIWNNWESFWGENKTGHWANQVEYEIPQIKIPTGGFKSGSLADVLGVPVYKGGNDNTISHLPIRGYCKIWNDWYRDENLQDPCYITMDETTVTGKNYDSNTWDRVTDTEKGGALLRACRFHDYFSACLPDLQRGQAVTIPLGQTAPVIGTTPSSIPSGYTVSDNLLNKNVALNTYQSGGSTLLNSYDADDNTKTIGYPKVIGLSADLSNAIGATITQLRQSVAIQHFYEQLARGGGRYIEYLSTVWGTEAKDDTLQRSIYLGGRRFPININQVLQTSSTDSTSPLGNTGAFSCTVNEDDLFTYSTTEHALVYVMAVIRTNHSFSQGLPRMFSRKKWTDFYIPTFDGLSDMPVYNKELYFTGTSTDDEVFGYQESFADYRIQQDRVFGQLRVDSKDSTGATNSLAVYNYQDNYTSLPYLSDDWIQEDGSNFKRTVTLQDTENDDFQCEFYLKGKFSRVMPTYGVPGIKYI